MAAVSEESGNNDDMGSEDSDDGDEADDTKGREEGGEIRRSKTATTIKSM